MLSWLGGFAELVKAPGIELVVLAVGTFCPTAFWGIEVVAKLEVDEVDTAEYPKLFEI